MIQPIKVKSCVLGEGLAKICIPVTAVDLKEMQEQLKKILAAPFDLVEWRADFFEPLFEEGKLEEALFLLRDHLKDKPLLFTFRTKEEGGERSISLEDYEAVNIRAAKTGLADLVDVEWNRGEELMKRIIDQVHPCQVKVIGSFHDFGGTPSKERILEILTDIQKANADITKAAVMPKSERDVLTLLDATLTMKEKLADRPYITMSMGRLGSLSRLSGLLDGSAVTFGTAGRASAPGQMEAEAIARILPMM